MTKSTNLSCTNSISKPDFVIKIVFVLKKANSFVKKKGKRNYYTDYAILSSSSTQITIPSFNLHLIYEVV